MNNKITLKAGLTCVITLLVLMIAAYILTLVLPSGEYLRTINDAGQEVIDSSLTFSYVEGNLSFWKFIASPLLIFTSDNGITVIGIIIFLLIVGGIFQVLNKCNILNYLIEFLLERYKHKKYVLMALLILCFMLMGSFIGSFEEVTTFVPIIVALAIAFGWDGYAGISMSILAAACGFAAGVMNPFSVGVAQGLLGLKTFSGIWLRAVNFVLIYGLLFTFTFVRCKHLDEKNKDLNLQEFQKGEKKKFDSKMKKALLWLGILIALGVVLIVLSAFISFLSDIILLIVGFVFLIAGTVSSIISGVTAKNYFKWFLEGIINFMPAILMILLASSVKYILTEGKVIDTILYYAYNAAKNLPKYVLILFIYLLALVINFFIASGTAKAFLLMPIIGALAQIFDLSPQLCVIAYAFGDGFSNAFYPTNPVLLISLGFANMSYGEYFKKAWKFQFANLIMTSGILIFGYLIGY